MFEIRTRPSQIDTPTAFGLAGVTRRPHLRPAFAATLRHLAGTPVDPVEVEDDAARKLLRRAGRDAVMGALERAVDDGVVSMPDDVAAELRTQARFHAQVQMLLDAMAVRVHELAAPVGIELTVLKGVATSRLDHAHSTDRNYVDVDLLVRHADHDRLVAVLRDEQFTIDLRGPADGPTFFKGSELRSADGRGLDLHTRLFRQSSPRHDGWIAERESISIAGRAMWALDRPWRLAHAASHLVLTPVDERKHNISIDIAAMVRDGADIEGALDRAATVHLEGVTGWGIAIACRASGVDVDYDLLDRHVATHRLRDRSAQWAFLDESRRLTREQIPNLLGVSPRNRLTLVRSFLFPSREYREYWKREGAGGQLRFLWGKVRGASPRGR